MSADTIQVLIEIQLRGGNYQGTRRLSTQKKPRGLKNLQLAPDSCVMIHGQERRLREPLEALVAFRPGRKPIGFDQLFDERGQQDLGSYLHGQLFQGMSAGDDAVLDQPGQQVNLVIVSCDSWICRIPWVLLTRNDEFLARNDRWTIALARDAQRLKDPVDLPRAPKMLIAAPNPRTQEYPNTSGTEHVQELETMLHLGHAELVRGRRLWVVETWAALDQHRPDVLYYYGHGLGNEDIARLIFPDRPEGVPVADLANLLKNLPQPPLIVYLNCCHGDAGGGLGAGGQLAAHVPALVSTRCVAYVPQARAQAVQFFQDTLLQAKPPEQAVRELYQPIREQDTVSTPRWMNPVFYRGYGVWHAHPVAQQQWLPHADWQAQLDRDMQWPIVFDNTYAMLHHGRRRGLAFLWHGREGDGLDHFHQRLKVQLRDRLRQDVCLLEYRPHWPEELASTDPAFNADPSFVEMYRQAFDVGDLRDIAIQVRKAADPGCPKKLVYFRHQVLTRRQALNPRFLPDYLSWWDATLPDILDPGQFGLVGISYQAEPTEDPDEFRQIVPRELHLEDLEYRHIDCHVLLRFRDVDKRHLRKFLEEIGFPLPANRREEILGQVWERSQGMYELIIQELQAWLRSTYGAGR